MSEMENDGQTKNTQRGEWMLKPRATLLERRSMFHTATPARACALSSPFFSVDRALSLVASREDLTERIFRRSLCSLPVALCLSPFLISCGTHS